MSLVSSGLVFTHRATIERDSSVSSDPDDWSDVGTDTAADWQTHISALRCRVWTTAGRELARDTETFVDEDMRMLVPLGTDVTEKDRVADVTERGAVIVSGPVGIRAVMQHADHLELVLERVS